MSADIKISWCEISMIFSLIDWYQNILGNIFNIRFDWQADIKISCEISMIFSLIGRYQNILQTIRDIKFNWLRRMTWTFCWQRETRPVYMKSTRDWRVCCEIPWDTNTQIQLHKYTNNHQHQHLKLNLSATSPLDRACRLIKYCQIMNQTQLVSQVTEFNSEVFKS